MKILLVTLIALFLLFTKVDAQQWQDVTPSGYENSYFISESFISAAEGWLFTEPLPHDNHELLHTSDGANTFERLLVLPYGYECHKIQMLDSLYGYAKINNSPDYKNYFWNTTDGGKTWQDITDTALFNPNRPLFGYNTFYFVNHNLGFFAGGNVIYRTENAGLNWSKMNFPTMIDSVSTLSLGIHTIYFTDEKYGWVACSIFMDAGVGLKTTDGGLNWVVCAPVAGYLYNVHFADSLNGGMVGSGTNKRIVGTQNNFESFSYDYDGDWNQWPTAICYQNDSTIWVSGLPPIINRSTDRGQTFTAYDTSYASSNEYTFIDNIQFFGHTGFAFSPVALLKLVDTLITTNKEVFPSKFELRVSPNPVTDKCEISVKLPSTENAILEIYSTQGMLMKKLENKLLSGNNKLHFDMHNWKPGVYFLRFTSFGNQTTRKIIKK